MYTERIAFVVGWLAKVSNESITTEKNVLVGENQQKIQLEWHNDEILFGLTKVPF